jgi:hypothetical protein
MNPNQLTDQLGLFLDVLETGSFFCGVPPSSADAFGGGPAHRQPGKRRRQPVIHTQHPRGARHAGGLAFAERARRIVAETPWPGRKRCP